VDGFTLNFVLIFKKSVEEIQIWLTYDKK
jgi:hypothetical protein